MRTSRRRTSLSQAGAEYVHWLQVAKDLSPHTTRAYAADVAAFERHLGGESRVEAIDRDNVLAFIQAQRSVGLSPSSIRRRAAGLRGFCRWLQSNRMLTVDPWSDTVIGAPRSKRLPRVVPPHELQRLLGFLLRAAGTPFNGTATRRLSRPHEATTLLAVGLMVGTGMRINELTGLRWDDVDLPSGRLRILGKGRRERQVFLTNTWLTELTSAYVQTRAGLHIDHPRLLFNARYAPLTPSAMRLRLAKASQAASLETRVTPHMLRHTAATQLLEAGVDIRYIQRLLGHASLSTTEIYTHVSDDALKRTIAKADVLGALLR